MVLNWVWFLPSGGQWRCPERFLVVTTGRAGVADIWQVKPRDTARHPVLASPRASFLQEDCSVPAVLCAGILALGAMSSWEYWPYLCQGLWKHLHIYASLWPLRHATETPLSSIPQKCIHLFNCLWDGNLIYSVLKVLCILDLASLHNPDLYSVLRFQSLPIGGQKASVSPWLWTLYQNLLRKNSLFRKRVSWCMSHGSLYLPLPRTKTIPPSSMEGGGGVAGDTQVMERGVCTLDMRKKWSFFILPLHLVVVESYDAREPWLGAFLWVKHCLHILINSFHSKNFKGC